MKIEICDYTRGAVCWVASCIAAVTIAFMIYRYNCLAYEQGYTQQQIANSQLTIWVRPASTNTTTK